ncbi:MAG: 4'-phosphopantetheinyl transferase superfamily protein [Burkholderiaceae bacterium]
MPPHESVTPTVHLVGLPAPDPGDDALRNRIHALLCPEEQARLATFRSPAAAWEYGCSHAALRVVLSRHLGIAPTAIAFDEPGTPFVPLRLRGPRSQGWQVNLSHSTPFAAIAVTRQGRIGIDIEALAHAPVALEGHRLYMSEAEVRQLASVPDAERAAAALRTWCLKEAVLKATGQGLALDARDLSLDRPTPGGPAIARINGDDTVFDVRLLQAGVDAMAVLALAQEIPAIAPRIEPHRLQALLA